MTVTDGKSSARASVSTKGPSAKPQAGPQPFVVPVTRRVPSVEAVATEPATRTVPASAKAAGAKSWPGGPTGP